MRACAMDAMGLFAGVLTCLRHVDALGRDGMDVKKRPPTVRVSGGGHRRWSRDGTRDVDPVKNQMKLGCVKKWDFL